MKAQIYQEPNGWTATAHLFIGGTFACGPYPTQQEALDALADSLKRNGKGEVGEVEVVDAPERGESVLGRREGQLRLW